ncbi:hypothetical protein Pla175_34550 [Pirellulimonas nuda]|uniref:Cell division protein FtsQ n=1 Tax=Pirellulimonas nuda TaxID=2528009 RepID=A0A518DF22_9BACT|nr:hypothetical protein [Pirellulimonas nuda]QDU90056.1 hypothetical protein Pla175_34550 [Pirellulimonas nuda]
MPKKPEVTAAPPAPAPTPSRSKRIGQIAVVLAVMAFATWACWTRLAGWMRVRPEYAVAAENIELVPPPPAWVPGDLRLDALRDAGARGGLSILDPPAELQQRLADALRFHPWVREVIRIRKAPPARVLVELEYRRPVAAVQWGPAGSELLLVDEDCVRLPERDLSDTARRRLPRIVAGGHKPLVGELWTDTRVIGALALVRRLGPYWDKLSLLEVSAHAQPEVRGQQSWPIFRLLTTKTIRIEWGAAPGLGPADEPAFEDKLARLLGYIAEHGPLDSLFDSPGVLEVRYTLTATPLTVKRSEVVK